MLRPRFLAAGAASLVGGATAFLWSKSSVPSTRHAALKGRLLCDAPRTFSRQATYRRDDKSSESDTPSSESSGSETTPSESKPNTIWRVSDIGWSNISDRIAEAIPTWAHQLPGSIRKLQSELSGAPGSLAEEIWQEAQDPNIHPEIIRPAQVRISEELCIEETQFLEKRKHHTRKALAKYLDIPEEGIHPDDVPVIALCGSGGGLRALVAGASSYLSCQEAGLFDVATYSAGVSGSCWLQILYYSSISGRKHDGIIKHLKNRLSTHIAYPPPLLQLATSQPTAKFLLSGGYEKYRGVEKADFGIVDLYGLMLGARLLVPKGDLGVDDHDLKLSHQELYLRDGENPLPIYTAVRHVIPAEVKDSLEKQKQARREAWFQWFELTPYEFWSEDIRAGIPTWSIGRSFEGGRTVWREDGHVLPEIRTPLFMGIFGSAFCASLSHYYKEIRPLIKSIGGLGGLDNLIEERDDDLIKLHPFDAATIPNYAHGLADYLPQNCHDSLVSTPVIDLRDSGMSNNLPVYPLLRQGRDVDVIIAFDASADVKQDNWLRLVDGYAKQRGIKGWPLGTGWPMHRERGPEATGDSLDETKEMTSEGAKDMVEQASNDQQASKERRTSEDQEASKEQPPSKDQQPSQDSQKTSELKSKPKTTDLGYCNIWVGTTQERDSESEPPTSTLIDDELQVKESKAGITVIYYPFVANDKVEGVDPMKSEYMSTWNFVYTPEQIDKVVELAKANFEEGAEKTKKCIRAVYERKKKQRLEREGGRDGFEQL